MNDEERYQLIPSFCEWHLIDANGTFIYNYVDPFGWDDALDEAKSVEDLEDFFKDEREAECKAWDVGDWEPNPNGLQVSPYKFTDDAISVMAKTLFDYYKAA